MVKKASFLLIFGFITLAFFGKNAQAAVRCETQYGGGQVCVRTGELQIDKKVWHPQNKLFVDNLGIFDYKFAPGEEAIFQLNIKNVGDATFDKVTVQDTLPPYFELTSGSLSFEISDLTPGETETREIRARVVSAEKIPNDKTVICNVNTAEVWSGDNRDRDTSQVCLEKKVLGVAVFPPTGPQGWWVVLLSSLITGATGIYLLKFKKV